mmetsp:Transcript_52320/g.86939  ORF Transcript_52320/g.86939 Transcript_52320/m.86939 type:complete len:440 (-) Transcript_52320:4047-5366(-)
MTSKVLAWILFAAAIHGALCQRCNGSTTLTSISGTFTDGGTALNFPGTSCTWLISPTNALSIFLRFTSFAIRQPLNFVNVYDGSNSAATSLQRISGTIDNLLPYDTRSSTGQLFVAMNTNIGGGNSAGFTASYWAATCAPYTALVQNGTFTEGNNNTGYAPYTFCSWGLSVAAPFVGIALDFPFISITPGVDYISVYEGVDATAKRILYTTGNSTGLTLVTLGYNLFVTLSVAGTQTGLGFFANFRPLDQFPEIIPSTYSIIRTVTSGQNSAAWLSLTNSAVAPLSVSIMPDSSTSAITFEQGPFLFPSTDATVQTNPTQTSTVSTTIPASSSVCLLVRFNSTYVAQGLFQSVLRIIGPSGMNYTTNVDVTVNNAVSFLPNSVSLTVDPYDFAFGPGFQFYRACCSTQCSDSSISTGQRSENFINCKLGSRWVGIVQCH